MNHGGVYSTPLAPTGNLVISFSTVLILKTLLLLSVVGKRGENCFYRQSEGGIPLSNVVVSIQSDIKH